MADRLIDGWRPRRWPGDLAALSVAGFGVGLLAFLADRGRDEQRRIEDARTRALVAGFRLAEDLRLYAVGGRHAEG